MKGGDIKMKRKPKKVTKKSVKRMTPGKRRR